MAQDPPSSSGPHVGGARTLLLYGAGFALLQFGLLFLAFAVTATPWFLTHDGYPAMLLPGYSLRLRHEDCEILIYGDSAPMSGLDPAIIQQMTGQKTCNIAEGSTIQAIVGSSFPLDRYLENNKRPRFLLAMYTPVLVKPTRLPFDAYAPEGMIYAMQYDRGAPLYRRVLRHPQYGLKFAIFAGQAILTYAARHGFSGPSEADLMAYRQRRDRSQGLSPFPLPPETRCIRTDLHTPSSAIGRYEESVAAFRRHYQIDGTRVLIDIAPVPTCDTLQDVYRERAHGLHDNAFETLPISFFNEGDVHFSPQGSRYISIEAARQILTFQENQTAAGPPTGVSGNRVDVQEDVP